MTGQLAFSLSRDARVGRGRGTQDPVPTSDAPRCPARCSLRGRLMTPAALEGKFLVSGLYWRWMSVLVCGGFSVLSLWMWSMDVAVWRMAANRVDHVVPFLEIQSQRSAPRHKLLIVNRRRW